MEIFTTPSVVIWFSTATLGIFATLVYVFTMRVVIYDILSMEIIPTLSSSILFCNLCYILLWISPRSGENRHTDIANFAKLIHCVAIFTILYVNYYPPHEEFKLICIGKVAKRTWVNFIQQYGKNCQRCVQNIFYYAVWQLLLYFYREFPWKILAVWLWPCCSAPPGDANGYYVNIVVLTAVKWSWVAVHFQCLQTVSQRGFRMHL